MPYDYEHLWLLESIIAEEENCVELQWFQTKGWQVRDWEKKSRWGRCHSVSQDLLLAYGWHTAVHNHPSLQSRVSQRWTTAIQSGIFWYIYLQVNPQWIIQCKLMSWDIPFLKKTSSVSCIANKQWQPRCQPHSVCRTLLLEKCLSRQQFLIFM